MIYVVIIILACNAFLKYVILFISLYTFFIILPISIIVIFYFISIAFISSIEFVSVSTTQMLAKISSYFSNQFNKLCSSLSFSVTFISLYYSEKSFGSLVSSFCCRLECGLIFVQKCGWILFTLSL